MPEKMSEIPIFYSFRRCPYAMRARLALLISGLPFELREVVLRDKPAQMLTASPKGTVPVLCLPDGRVVDESIDIMRYALGRHDPENWLAGDDGELIAMNDGPFKHHLDRYKYSDRHGSDPMVHRAAASDLLGVLDARLGEVGWLSGKGRTLADMAVFPFVRQFAAVDPDWFAALPLVNLQRWLAALVADPLFEAAMIRAAPWREGDAPLLLGA